MISLNQNIIFGIYSTHALRKIKGSQHVLYCSVSRANVIHNKNNYKYQRHFAHFYNGRLLYLLTGPEAKREPPPRPPPPSVAPPQQGMGPSGLPYPSYPVGMPVPYGATTAAPYPTYIPPPVTGGFNPYAAGVGGVMPYPQQG